MLLSVGNVLFLLGVHYTEKKTSVPTLPTKEGGLQALIMYQADTWFVVILLV